MCGIAGLAFTSRTSNTVNPQLLSAMRDTLIHRGPDDAGIYTSTKVGLAHRRLSIVDLALGHQPMANEDGSVQIVFNGEIYNHAEHREPLEQAGHTFATNADTESIVHLYEQHSLEFVHRLRGMFSLALWDESKRRLVLARDRMGIKPLYYSVVADGSIYFGSEIKAILKSGAVQAEPNTSKFSDYLANMSTSDDQTLFHGIKRLAPGQLLVWEDGNVEIQDYFRISISPSKDYSALSDNAVIQRWTDAFRDAVNSHLMADVPVGVLLSGGIDSTAIAAMMRDCLDRPFSSFSIAFDDAGANELKYARIAAAAFKTDHHEIILSPGEYFSQLPQMIWHEDEPIAHVASIPLHKVCKLASQKVKVVLTGEGSDELMAGYGKYAKTATNLRMGAEYEKWVPGFIRNVVKKLINVVPASTVKNKLLRTFLCRKATIEDLYFENFSVFDRGLQSELFHPDIRENAGLADTYATQLDLYHGAKSADTVSRLLAVDLRTYLHELLMKQDQMSMSASIESRVPFLDRELVDLTCSLSPHMKLRGSTTKFILREAMRDRIPDEILNRPKMGFPVPVGKWLRGDYRELVSEFILGERTLDRKTFDRDRLQSLVTEHNSGRQDHSLRLWSLLNLEIWWRQAIDGDSVDATSRQIEDICSRVSA